MIAANRMKFIEQAVAHMVAMCGILCCLVAGTAHAQTGHRCGTMHRHAHLMKTDPVYKKNRELIEVQTQKYVANLKSRPAKEFDQNTITIPVVVHIIWRNNNQNLSAERVQEQIDLLNDDFQALNEDITQVPGVFLPDVGNMNIEFCLASWQDKAGKWHEPITRTKTKVREFSISKEDAKQFSTGGHDAVRPGEFLNIWVCGLRPGLLGYATFPGGKPKNDGVVIAPYAFGRNQSGGNTYTGRTLTHEVGHWLNLYHIWGDRSCGDDLVDDTPRQEKANYGCATFPRNPNSCGTGNPDGDMFMNFMDYSNDACLHMFTKGQKERSRALFAASGVRETLTMSGFLCAYTPGIQNVCPCLPPDNPQVTNVTDYSIQVKWNALSQGQQFEVRYRKAVGGIWNNSGTQQGTTFDINGLVKNTLYSIQIRGYCAEKGLYSDWRSINVTTTQNRCPELNVTVDTVGATFVEFSWTNSSDYQYVEIHYSNEVAGGEIQQNRIQVTSQSLRIDSLKPDSYHNFEILAYCVSGLVTYSKVIKTTEVDDCATVTNLRHTLTGNGQNGALIEWDLPTDPPDKYVLSYNLKSGYIGTQDTLVNTTQQKVLTGLTAGKEYIVQLYSICGAEKVTGPGITFTTNSQQPNSTIDPHKALAFSAHAFKSSCE